MMKKLYGSPLLLVIMLLITACGFHLQGKINTPPQLRTLYLESNTPYSSFTQQLKQTLQHSSITLVNSRKDAPITLNIINTNVTQKAIGDANSEQTRVYQLNYNASFSLERPDGSEITGPLSASASQTFTLPPGALPDNSNITSTAQQSAQQALIQNIFNRLASQEVIKQLTKHQSTHEKSSS